MSEEDPGPSTQKKQKRESGQMKGQGGRKQSFREAWLEQDEFKGWLAPDPSGNPQRAFCNACGTTITAGSKTENLSSALRKTKFSLFVHEGTDISSTKLLCCVARYLSLQKREVVTQLFEVIPLDAVNCSAEVLAGAVEDSLAKREIPIENIIGLACDNASVIVGKRNSLTQKLQQKGDRSFVLIRCICHSTHIAASKAALKLPRYLEDLLRNIASYFSQSSKRQAQLCSLQEYLRTEKRKILCPSETRWLVLHSCIERVFEEWETLRLLFLQASVEDRIVAAEPILNQMNSITEAYLKFIKYALNFFNKLNALFQSNENLIAELQRESQRLLRCLLQNFIQPSVLE
ncbi:hypothetical protein HPB49_007871 [Dermacentor silvarum]|uniref:Uncharacterized protein n=1 Tax=Dermacentor silvarum TaxID=543639 RepID=A0ACB8D3T9_DERSI|nr:hypothetical protein HPB49_007871 [Dermacentor silvarum]